MELPEVGATVTKGETFGVVESVKVRGATDSIFSQRAIPIQSAPNSRLLPNFNSTRSKLTLRPPPEHRQAASDVYAPVSGEVLEVNAALSDEPAKVNAEPFGGGWMMKVRVSNAGDTADLLDAKAYTAHCEAGGH